MDIPNFGWELRVLPFADRLYLLNPLTAPSNDRCFISRFGSGFHLYKWMAPSIEGSHPILPSLQSHFLSLLLLAPSLGEGEVLVDPGDDLPVMYILYQGSCQLILLFHSSSPPCFQSCSLLPYHVRLVLLNRIPSLTFMF